MKLKPKTPAAYLNLPLRQGGGNESHTTLFLSIGVQYPDFFLACGAIFWPAARQSFQHDTQYALGVEHVVLSHNSSSPSGTTESASRCAATNVCEQLVYGYVKTCFSKIYAFHLG